MMNAASSRSCTGVLVGYVAYVLMINWGRSWSGRCPVGKFHMYNIVNTVPIFVLVEFLFEVFLFRSDECGRVFAHRKNGTRFDRENIQATHNSGRKTVKAWAWISADGGGTLFAFKAGLIAKSISTSSKMYCCHRQDKDFQRDQ